ncbi:hypothetical protein C7999DRAFT_29300 [Corynascus novoguineensis]|uniref:Uncharacterized protein n=1 Tax=Corynascus novoguineensis TaxID=1126955 RepID=A0AAN7HHM2_9PEZI|nr:hypothetical protein C7999DRAFT_29300 [Corynascus novoguineensis]
MSPPYTGFAGGAGWLESRDDNTQWMSQGNAFNNISRVGFNQTFSAAQQRFWNDLKFSAAKSIRTSAIILASFNIIAAFATALGILFDSYFRKKRNDRSFRFWRNGFTFVPEADVYPLVLSVGIFIQSLIFAGVQSTGLDNFFGAGCTWMAQLMLPAVFIAPYTQLVFGVEVAIRALRKKPFEPRGKYNVSICLSIIGMLLLANFLIADFDRSPNFCLTSLFWFVAHYSIICFSLLVAIASIVLIAVVTVFVRLHRSIKVEVTARVAASRMVYYLALAVISISFMIPFFFVQGFRNDRRQSNNALNLAMIASVAANVSGLMTGGLYLFLKSSTMSTIGPRDKVGEYENRRARYKITRRDSNGPDEDGFDRHLMNPVTGPQSLRRVDSEESLIGPEKEEEILDGNASVGNGRRSRDSIRSNRLVSAMASVLMPKAPEPARIPPTPVGAHARKRSYSLFPRGPATSKASLLLPATTYSPADSLKPPPSMANLVNKRHRRDSSLVSSATVQIGLRLSSVDDMPPVAQNKTATNDGVVHTLGCPNAPTGLDMQSPKRAGTIAVRSAARPAPTQPTQPTEEEDSKPQRDSAGGANMRKLPVVPKIDSQVPNSELEKGKEEFTLSPKVYSPNSPSKVKLPSPKGVGFSMSSGSKQPAGTSNSSPGSPPRRRGTGDTITPSRTAAKGDWI